MSEPEKEPEKEPSRLMKALELIEKENSFQPLTLGDLVELLGEMGHGILMLLLCMLFMQPIPFPGISTLIGFIIMIAATLQFLGRAPWLPARFRSRPLPQKGVQKMIEVTHRIWNQLEKMLQPRLLFLTSSPGFRLLNLMVILLSGLLLALPLPIPFTNTVPAIVIISMSFAQLEEDGLLVLFSYLLSVGMVMFFLSLGAGVLKFLA